MKIKVGDKLFSAKDEPVLLIFEDDEERHQVLEHLSAMEDKEGVRKYLMYPDDKGYTVDDMNKFMINI